MAFLCFTFQPSLAGAVVGLHSSVLIIKKNKKTDTDFTGTSLYAGPGKFAFQVSYLKKIPDQLKN
jgi:hypothetical protein